MNNRDKLKELLQSQPEAKHLEERLEILEQIVECLMPEDIIVEIEKEKSEALERISEYLSNIKSFIPPDMRGKAL